jgi:hypothetical protein
MNLALYIYLEIDLSKHFTTILGYVLLLQFTLASEALEHDQGWS